MVVHIAVTSIVLGTIGRWFESNRMTEVPPCVAQMDREK